MIAMDNETFKSEKMEDEYHFSEAESIPTFTETAPKKNILADIKRKHFIIAFVAIVLILGVYKLVNVIFTSNNSQANKSQQVSSVINKQQQVEQVANAKQVVTPVMPMQQTQEFHQQVSTLINERLSSIESQNQANLDKLSSQINELQNTVTNLDERLNKLSNIAQDLITQQQQIAAQKMAVKQKTLIKKQVVIPKPIYYVRAVVPGRAWLETQHGKTITVSLGDNLPGYGVITAIDTNQGTLTTSLGAIIGYSPDDS